MTFFHQSGSKKPLKHIIKALLFDIGGTIVEKQNHGSRDPLILSEMVNFLRADCTVEKLSDALSLREAGYKRWREQSLTELSYEERWVKFLLPDYPQDFIRQHAGQLQKWWSESRGKREISPQTVETLRELSARGYILGSISHTSVRYLEEAGVRALFKVSLQSAEFGKRKPHPAPFMAAARACGVLPCECAYVGDRPSRDIVGPREAGYGQVFLLQREGVTAEPLACPMRADAVIHALSELLGYFPIRGKGYSAPREQVPDALLYDAGISTKWWSKERDSADEFCHKARALGFARFELNHQVPPEELAQFDLERYHIGSLHDPCPAVIPNKQLEMEDRQVTSLDEGLRQSGVDVVKHTIEQACRLGARQVVIHPGRIPGDHSLDNHLRSLFRMGLKGMPQYTALRDQLMADRKNRIQPHLDALLTSMRQVAEFAEGCGILLGLENRFHYYELPDFEEMDILLNTFPQPWIGWQLDVGHIKVHDQLGLMSFQQWLEVFSQRIVGVHLHDVRGIVDHLVPGSGEIDFHWLSGYLPTEAIRTLEVDKSVSDEAFRMGLRHLEDAGCIIRL